MSHVHASDTPTGGGSIVIHRSRLYDLSFGWAIRRSDEAILRRAGVGDGDRVLDVGTGPGYLALAASRTWWGPTARPRVSTPRPR